MSVDVLRYLLILLTTITSVLVSLILWNIKTFLTSFKDHVDKDDSFATSMMTLTATIVECNRQIDQRLQRIEAKLWS